MDGWTLALFGIAGYIAVMALVRLMLARRRAVLEQFRRQVEDEQQRRDAEEAPARRRSA